VPRRFALWSVALWLSLAGAAQAQTAQPVLLVASPDLRGSYRETLLVAVPAAGGHVGFILNRATETKLATMFPGHPPSAKVAEPVYYGGPQMEDTLFAVVRRDPGGKAAPFFGDLFIAYRRDALDRIIERMPNDARYFAGFVAWEPDELADEIDAGFWYVADADPSLFFRRDIDTLWHDLVTRLGNGHAPQRGPGFWSVQLGHETSDAPRPRAQ